jgi:hypothetical protein
VNGSPGNADRLYAVPLEDFVAERKRLAKELRDGGDRAAAAEVAKLPKPTPPAWALNQLAREEPEAVAAWLDAAEALRDASANPGAGLREAMSAHRDATRQLLASVRDRARPGGRPLSDPMLDRVRDLLQAATADAEQAEALRRGTITEAGDEAGTEPAVPADEPPERERAPRRAAKPRTADRAEERRAAKEREAERKANERAERAAELERLVSTAEAEVARLRDEAAERERTAEAAGERLEEARRTLHRTESEAAAAHDAVQDARAAAAAAERELERLTRQLRKASS